MTRAAMVLSTGSELEQRFPGLFEESVRRPPYPRQSDGNRNLGTRPLARTPMCGRSRGARARRRDRLRARAPRARRRGRGARASSRARCPGTTRSRSATCARRSSRSRPPSQAGARICVHGDYDADGICATALAVLLLRELGAEPTWHLPSRFEEGYGLTSQTLTRLAEEGFDLVLTVDCGITAVAEVEHARSLGLEVVVTDHHRPADDVPRLPGRRAAEGRLSLRGPLRHRRRLEARAGAARARASRSCERHLDVVALATVADVVPLVDENRALALLGLRRLAQTQKAGPARADARRRRRSRGARRVRRSVSASRRGSTRPVGSGRPEAALALLLTEDADEAKTLAEELESLNRERQAVEERISRAAIDQIESWPEARRRRRGYVVAGEDWHEGVIGIVASRLVERYGRPVVLIAGTDGEWKGSGRSVPAFDLHGALGACSEHLERFGGHRAAAGLTIEAERVETFAAAFAAHADAALAEDDLRPRDARRRGRPRREARARPLRRAAAARAVRPRQSRVSCCSSTAASSPSLSTVGDGKHLRFRVRQRGRDAGSAIAFGMGGQLDRFRRDGALRRRVPAAGEPLERHRLAAARRAAGLRRSRRIRRAARLARRRSGAPAKRRGRRRRARSSTSSSSPTARSAACSSRRRSGAARAAAAAARRGRLIEDLGRSGER